MLFFTDDAVLFAHSQTKLQSLLIDVEVYCKYWGLKINTNQTKVMIFERGRSTQCNIKLDNIRLKLVDSFKY